MECSRIAGLKFYWKNTEQERSRRGKEYRLNPEKFKARQRQWAKDNPEKARETYQRYRAANKEKILGKTRLLASLVKIVHELAKTNPELKAIIGEIRDALK